MKKISVLMPAYNAALYIEESICSILKQSYDQFELLICDDASLDATYEIISKIEDDRIKLFRNEKNLGYLKTCNKLAEIAAGDYITFQDADDISEKSRFDVLVNELLDKNLDLIGSNVAYISKQNKIIGRSFYLEDINKDRLLDGGMQFCGAAILCKRKVIDEMPLYDECFDRIGAEDFDWIYRASLRYKIGNSQQVLYSYRMHPASVSQSSSNNLSIQLCSEHIARDLFRARMHNQLNESVESFMSQRKIIWQQYLEQTPSVIILKKASINSLSGKRLRNLKLIYALLTSHCLLKDKVRGSSLMLLDVMLGHENVFKLKTFYKKYFGKSGSYS